jgi:Tfp pilus assembly protein PilF
MRRIAMIHGSIRTASRGALMRGLRCLALISALAVAACDSQDPTTFAEYLARAEQYRNAGEIRASLIELKNALHKDPDNAIGRLLLAQAELDLGDGVSAGIELQRAK